MVDRIVSVDENYLFPTPLEARLASKMTASVTDSAVASRVNGAQTGAAIDQRITDRATPLVQPIVAEYIASSQVVVDAAAAAVNANPTIAGINTKLGTANYFRGVLPDGANPNTMTANTDNGTWQLSSSFTYLNVPFTGAGQIEINNTGTGSGSQVATRYGFSEKYERQIQNKTNNLWFPWERQGIYRIAITSNTDIDTLRTPGTRFIVTSNAIGSTLINAPSIQPATLDVEGTTGGLISHTWKELYSSGGGTTFSRTTASIGTTPYPFGAWKDLGATPTAPTSTEAGLANEILVQDFSRRYGGRIKTLGKGAVAFRFDHGLANYRDMIKPLMDSRLFKHSQVLNSRAWGLAENTGVTEAIVNGWVQQGLLEIWNHGALNHSDADTSAKLTDSIVNGLAELRAQIPSAKIDGWAVPGVTGTLYMGFNGGITPDKFYTTEAGRLILANHAVSTGGIANTYQRVLDGTVRQGQHQYTLDERTVAQAKAEIDLSIANGTGLQFMLHPSVVGATDRMTLAQFTEILDYVKSKETAGDLLVLSPYELMVADKF